MAEGRSRHDWAQTSQLLSMLYACNRTKEMPTRSPADFNPWEAGRTKEPDLRMSGKEGMALLKGIFAKR